MQHQRSPHVWLQWIPLAVACYNGGDAPAAQVELGGSSSSSTNPGPPTTSTPPTTTATGSTTSTSTGLTEMSSSSDTSLGDTSTGATTADPASSSGDTPSPSCGDGQPDPGEECDPGLAALSDTGACTLTCKIAKCGDNLVWAGKEACDNGPSNNDDLYGGCTSQCQLGPRCNDGKLQSPEECDLGVDNGSGEIPLNGVACDDGCRFEARLVFLSSVTYKGGDLGGAEGAHIKCQNLAKQAKYDNAAKFMAWISDAQHSPFQDFNHAQETVGLAYVRPDGVRVAKDWNDLVLNGPSEGIIVTETGETLLYKAVWTGTAPSGKVFDPTAHCQAWSSSALEDTSRRGRSGVEKQQAADWMAWSDQKQWTSQLSYTCNNAHRIYCFEQ